jgi:hypothetical protein
VSTATKKVKHLVNIPEYWQLEPRRRPRTFSGLLKILKKSQREITGVWERTITNHETGEVLERLWSYNVITDNGALNAIKNYFAYTGGTVNPTNIMCISTEVASTKTSSSISAGAITSVPVTALSSALANGSQIIIGYGTANATTATLSAGASSGATSITVSSVTIPGGGIASGADVVPVPTSTDNPTGTPTGGQYQSLVSGDFSYTPGVGSGNRTGTVTKKFLGASTTAGTYTAARLSNANPIVSGAVGATLFLPQATINSSTDQTFVFIIKL